MIRRIATVLTFVVIGIGVIVTTGGMVDSSSTSGGGKTFKIAFDNAFGITQGGDLRVGGVKAGQTTDMTISNGPECQDTSSTGIRRACAIVTAQVTTPGFQSFRTDASCSIRQQSLIGEYYVDCQPGNAKSVLASGAIIPASHTASTIPADLVQDVMRAPYRERLQLIVAELGTGLAGRPQDIAELLHKAHPGLRETDRVLRILANQDTVIKNFISNSNTVVRQLDLRKADLQNWLKQAGQTANISASRSSDISLGFQRLPEFLDQLRGTMSRLGQLTDAQTPLLIDLHRAAPDLNTFLTKLGPFTQASRPAFKTLSTTSDAGLRAFRDSSQEIKELKDLAAQAPATAKPLRQFLQTADSTKRATEANPLAASLSPPSPDPTANAKGFTAFEGFWNYWYYQTQALSLFDQYGHVLRGVAIADNDCGKYIANLRGPDMKYGSAANLAVRQKCNSWLGPNQPGVTTPDFTPVTSNGTVKISSSAAAAKAAGRTPAAAAKPGQIDYSVPHPTLSPSQQQILQQLQAQAGSAVPNASAPSPPSLNGASAGQILNYLLGP